MASLTTKQRAFLRSLAHPLKPLFHIGKEGVSASALGAVQDAFNTRELLKVKVLDTASDSARDTGALIAGRIADAQVVAVIGRTVILYRRHPDKPKILLPS